MTRSSTELIDSLVEDAGPVRPVSAVTGRLLLLAVGMATLAVMHALAGFRDDMLRLSPDPEVALAAGLMALLAVAAGLAAVRMARPQVGAPSAGAPWALMALLVVPIVALGGLASGSIPLSQIGPGVDCLGAGLAASVATLGFLAWWQKRGAPVNPPRAAWLAGLAAGAIGSLAVTLECPTDGLGHIGLWHVAVTLIAGIAARIALPPLLRW